VVVIPSSFIDWFAVQQRVPVWLYLQTELVILIGIEIAYGVALLLSGAAVPGTSIRLGSPLFDIGDSVKERIRRIGRTE
jgi:hypothetical protein